MISCLKMFFQRLLQSTSTLLSPSDIDVDMVRKLNEKKKNRFKKGGQENIVKQQRCEYKENL